MSLTMYNDQKIITQSSIGRNNVEKIIAWIKQLPLWLRAGIVGFLCGLIVCAGLITGDVRSLRERQAAVDRDLGELIDQNKISGEKLNRLNASIADLKGSIDHTGVALQHLDGAVGNLADSVGTVELRVERIEERQDAVNAELGRLADQFSSLTGELSNVSDSIGEIASGLHSAADSLSGADASLDAATDILRRLQKISPDTKDKNHYH